MKHHLKPGFTIIEFLIGIMISAIMLTASLTIYNQISKSCRKIQTITTQDIGITILQKRLSDDLQGLCPLWFTKEHIKSAAEAKKNQSQNSQDKKNNFFYAQTLDEQLDFMTFVSTNTLQTYPAPENYIARIVYKLKKDTSQEKFFILQRKEETHISDEFNFEKIQEGKFYTILKNIKKCFLEYGFTEQQDEKDTKNNPQEFKIKWVKQWSTKDEEQQKDGKNKTPDLPEAIKLTITLQEFTDAPEVIYTFYSILPQSKNISLNSLAKKRNDKETAAQQNNLSNASNIMNRIQSAAQQNGKGIVHA